MILVGSNQSVPLLLVRNVLIMKSKAIIDWLSTKEILGVKFSRQRCWFAMNIHCGFPTQVHHHWGNMSVKYFDALSRCRRDGCHKCWSRSCQELRCCRMWYLLAVFYQNWIYTKLRMLLQVLCLLVGNFDFIVMIFTAGVTSWPSDDHYTCSRKNGRCYRRPFA